jgi:hypothetical protein
VSDIDTAAADSLKVLDSKRPIREADIAERGWEVCFVPEAEVAVIRSVELVIQPDVQDVVGGCCAVVQLH